MHETHLVDGVVRDGVVRECCCSDSPDHSRGLVSDRGCSCNNIHARGEVAVLAAVQRALNQPGVVPVARELSHFGEHSAGWFAAGLVGALVDRPRRRQWLASAATAVGAHAASIVVKRVVRRRRPEHPSVRVLVGTPSRLSFPSAHATSTTAAAVVYSGMTGRNLVPVLVAPMLASRLVLGVHYPTDVFAGAALGGAIGALARRAIVKKEES